MPGLSKPKLRTALEYIERRLDTELSLHALAKEVGISPYYFSRLFKLSTGVSFHKYVVQRRIDRAKVLLTSTDHRLADIALRCGFANQSHFSVVFGALVGSSPREFRYLIRS